jgi:hypothetical protein
MQRKVSCLFINYLLYVDWKVLILNALDTTFISRKGFFGDETSQKTTKPSVIIYAFTHRTPFGITKNNLVCYVTRRPKLYCTLKVTLLRRLIC